MEMVPEDHAPALRPALGQRGEGWGRRGIPASDFGKFDTGDYASFHEERSSGEGYLVRPGLDDQRFGAVLAGGFGPGWPEFPLPFCFGALTGL